MANSSSVFNETAEWCLENAIQTQDGELLSGLWYVGVIMSICASCASNLGVNIQKVRQLYFTPFCPLYACIYAYI